MYRRNQQNTEAGPWRHRSSRHRPLDSSHGPHGHTLSAPLGQCGKPRGRWEGWDSSKALPLDQSDRGLKQNCSTWDPSASGMGYSIPLCCPFPDNELACHISGLPGARQLGTVRKSTLNSQLSADGYFHLRSSYRLWSVGMAVSSHPPS